MLHRPGGTQHSVTVSRMGKQELENPLLKHVVFNVVHCGNGEVL